jgi:hypothetical protein
MNSTTSLKKQTPSNRRYIYTVALASFLMSATAHANPITFTDVSATGTFSSGSSSNLTTPGNLSLLTDGIFPGEGSFWQSSVTITFNQWGSTYDREYFTFDMGSLFLVDDIIISSDNNDSYTIEYSPDNTNWLNLTTANLSYGEMHTGMDTLSSIFEDSEYVTGLNFAQSDPARYLRIYVDGYQGNGPTSTPDVGDGAYAIGEFQAFGVVYEAPEPATMLFFATALLGFVGLRIKKK